MTDIRAVTFDVGNTLLYCDPPPQEIYASALSRLGRSVFGVQSDTFGWMVAVKPSEEVLAKFADGTYTGFSIGGTVEGWEPDTEAAA